MKLPLQATLFGGFGLTLVFLAGLVFFTYRSSEEFAQHATAAKRAQEVLTRLEMLVSLSTDAETGGRGFTLTGDEAFLEPYHKAVQSTGDVIRGLRGVISDPGQQHRMESLTRQLAERLEFSRQLVELRRNQGFEAARERIATGEGKRIQDQIRAAVGEMKTFESEILSQREDRAQRAYRYTRNFIVGGGVLTLAILGFALIFSKRELAARNRAEAQLRARNEELESFSALKAAHQQLSRHVDNTPLAVVEWDREFRVTRWSQRAESMFGWSFEEVRGKTPGEIGMVFEAEVADVDRTMVDLMEQRASRNFSQNRNVRKDGSVIHCEWYNSVVFDAEGELASILSLADDVTAEVVAGQELRRSHEQLESRVEERTAELELAMRALEQSNEELEQFAYVASHDLQEPLRMVSSFTKLLADRYRGKLDKEADEFIAYAQSGAARMQDMIRDLLELSRVRVDPAAQAMEVDLDACLATVRQNLSKRIEDSGAEIVMGPLPRLRGNGSQLNRLFQNLIGNALKFVNDETPRIRVTAETGDSGSLVTFSVEDNGIGIEPEHRKRLFQIFQRLHSRERYEGTGIGLTICKKIVEQHGGKIWIDDTASGRGTAFRFTLPAA